MKAIFDDGNGRVVLIHNRPDELSSERRAQAALEVESVPERPDVDYETQRAELRVEDGALAWNVIDR